MTPMTADVRAGVLADADTAREDPEKPSRGRGRGCAHQTNSSVGPARVAFHEPKSGSLLPLLWRAPRCGAALPCPEIKSGRAGARPSSKPLGAGQDSWPRGSVGPIQVASHDATCKLLTLTSSAFIRLDRRHLRTESACSRCHGPAAPGAGQPFRTPSRGRRRQCPLALTRAHARRNCATASVEGAALRRRFAWLGDQERPRRRAAVLTAARSGAGQATGLTDTSSLSSMASPRLQASSRV